MSTTKFTRSGTQTKTFVELLCTPSFGGGLHEIFTFFSAVHILLSITAFLTNSLILVALHKESSLHRPSKLLYRSLATTDLLVGLVAQPLYATYWMSLVQEHWSLCRYAFDAAYITGSALFLTSLMTMTAEPTKFTEHSSIQKSSVWCTVGEVSISCLFCTILYRGNRDCT